MAFANNSANATDTEVLNKTDMTDAASDVGQMIITCTHPKTGVGVPFQVSVTNATQDKFYGVGSDSFTLVASAANIDVTITPTQVNADIGFHVIEVS